MATDGTPCTLPLPSSPLVAEMQQLLDVGRIPPPAMLESSVHTITCLTERCPMDLRYSITMHGAVRRQLYEFLRYSEDDATDVLPETDEGVDIKYFAEDMIMDCYQRVNEHDTDTSARICDHDLSWFRIAEMVLKGFVNNPFLNSNRARRCFLYNVFEIFDDVVVSVTVNFEMTLRRAAEIEANGQGRNDPGNSVAESWIRTLENEQNDHECIVTEHQIMHNILLEWSLCGLLLKQPLFLTCLPRAETYDHCEYFKHAPTGENGTYAALWQRYQRAIKIDILDALWNCARIVVQSHDMS
ncbi:hypothetical protein CYMTET_7303 [Cymbomonas tetramitiformis]|uniref:Uncharacterized protein n=1 Tax=Cymbomonas tetramitiformis TaxID=36881 RepID=A0AAE0GVS6_9CHLO|nr:hypothetical protein CYMTET_44586 [Cymbomonas tetramitiformis]KAK3285075.1 hypothetical protein CYMTET_7303 [Cymbomonas tetramitiformis]|eukprot:gene24352-29591_t